MSNRWNPTLTITDVRAIVAAADAGTPIPELAARYGVTHRAITYRLETYGDRDRPEPTGPRVDRAPVPVIPELAPMGDWVEAGVCRQSDPEAWFPESKGQNAAAAKKLCRSCEVMDQCRAWALDNDERFGVWGGLSPREREAILRDRRREAAA